MLNTVFKATIIVAGAKSASKALNVLFTASPTPTPIREPRILSAPKPLTITNTAPAIRNVWDSFPVTLVNPTSIPRRTNIA